MMRKIFGFASAALAMMAIAGCQPQQPKPAMDTNMVLDVKAVPRTPRSYAIAPQMVTPPDEPMVPLVIEPLVTSTPVASGHGHAVAASHIGSSTKHDGYTVKKGDTLFHIAKAEYGDGKKWTMLASANPGLTPQSLRVGQTIVIP